MGLIRDDRQGGLNKTRLTLPATPPPGRNPQPKSAGSVFQRVIGPTKAFDRPAMLRPTDVKALQSRSKSLRALGTDFARQMTPFGPLEVASNDLRNPSAWLRSLVHGPPAGSISAGTVVGPGGNPLLDAAATEFHFTAKTGAKPDHVAIATKYGLDPQQLLQHVGGWQSAVGEMLSNNNPQAQQMSPRYQVNQLTDLLARVKETQKLAVQKAMQPRAKLPGPTAGVMAKSDPFYNKSIVDPWLTEHREPMGADHVMVPWNDFTIKPPRLSRDNVPLEAFPKPPPVEQYYEPGQLADYLRTLAEDPNQRGYGDKMKDPEVALDALQAHLNQRWATLRGFDAEHRAREEKWGGKPVVRYDEGKGPRVNYLPTRTGVPWSSLSHEKLLQLYETFGIDPQGFLPARKGKR